MKDNLADRDEFEEAFPPGLDEAVDVFLPDPCQVCYHINGNPDCPACHDSELRDPPLPLWARIKIASRILWTGRRR